MDKSKEGVEGSRVRGFEWNAKEIFFLTRIRLRHGKGYSATSFHGLFFCSPGGERNTLFNFASFAPLRLFFFVDINW
jgi:hypothetical protein